MAEQTNSQILGDREDPICTFVVNHYKRQHEMAVDRRTRAGALASGGEAVTPGALAYQQKKVGGLCGKLTVAPSEITDTWVNIACTHQTHRVRYIKPSGAPQPHHTPRTAK